VAGDSQFWDGLLGAPGLPWGRAPSPAVDVIARRLPPGAAVLVPGCGYGRNALGLAERGFKVTAYDCSPAAIVRARAEFAHPYVRYAVRDALADEARDARYAGILCHFTLHLFRAPERRRLIENLVRQLGPGGLLLATGLSTRCSFYGNGVELEPDTWSNPGWVPIHFYTPDSLMAEMKPLEALEAFERDEPEDKPGGPVLTPAVYALARAATSVNACQRAVIIRGGEPR
jgi:SAM-dependent methyltransferase